MNREPASYLDACLNNLFHEEQRLLTQTTMQQHKFPFVPMAYTSQGKLKGKDIRTIYWFCCKGFDHYTSNC